MFFSGVKSGSSLVCRLCDSTSGNTNKVIKQRCVSANSLSISEFFDDIWLVLNVRRL